MPRRLAVTFDEDLHLYRINNDDVPSVTQILDETVPKVLHYWGYRVGLAAANHLIETRSWPALVSMSPEDFEAEIRKDEASDLTLQLSPDRVRDTAGDAGTAVHKAIEVFSTTGDLPALEDFDPDRRGFIQAFSRFILDQDPEVEEAEVIVAHPEQRYAGKLDWIARYGERGRGLTDFKTTRRTKRTKSRGVEPVFELYRNHKAQVRLYEEAYVATETFHGKADEDVRPDFRAIVVLHESGDYVMLDCPPAAWALALPGQWWSMHAEGELKAPWEKDPKRRAAALARNNTVTK